MGGGGGSKDKTKSAQTTVQSPEAIAAMREAADTASGVAGVMKNMPWINEQADSPAYRQALNDTANTWAGWMGRAPTDVTQGMPAPTQGTFGAVSDYGQQLNNAMAALPPDIQAMMARWTGPGLITEGSPYTPLKYDPYLNQKKVLKKNKKKGIGTALADANASNTTPTTYGGGSYT
jgi:hypothetical protein